jgi:hypothetical protein
MPPDLRQPADLATFASRVNGNSRCSQVVEEAQSPRAFAYLVMDSSRARTIIACSDRFCQARRPKNRSPASSPVLARQQLHIERYVGPGAHNCCGLNPCRRATAHTVSPLA